MNSHWTLGGRDWKRKFLDAQFREARSYNLSKIRQTGAIQEIKKLQFKQRAGKQRAFQEIEKQQFDQRAIQTKSEQRSIQRRRHAPDGLRYSEKLLAEKRLKGIILLEITTFQIQ